MPRSGSKAVSHPRGDGGRGLGCLSPLLVAAVLICVGAFLVILSGGEVAVPGRCPTGFGWGPPGGSGEAKELLEETNFEASPAAVRDLEAGIVDERLISTLQTVSEEHQVCVTAFKEGHYFLPGVPDTTVIPDGYGEAGALFSKYTRSGGEVPRSVGRGGSHGRTVYDVEVRVLGYFSSLVRFVQPGQILEGLIQCTA